MIEWIPENMIWISVALPILALALVRVFDEQPNLRESGSILVAIATFAVNCVLASHVFADERPRFEMFEMLPGFKLAFEVEPLGMVFALVASGLWILTTIYAIGYMRGHKETNQTRFFSCFAIAIFAALAAAFASNLFTPVSYTHLTLPTICSV